MPKTEAQKRAAAKYRKKLRQVNLTFYPGEKKLYEHLKKQENKSGYLKDLIREDMEEERAS